MRALSTSADRHVLAPALGVLFADPLDRRIIADGLLVQLAEAARPHAKLRLVANARGVFVAHKLPRMRAVLAEADASPAQGRPYILSVADGAGRYLPLRVELPLPHRGLLSLDATVGSPFLSEPFVPLYSAPTRSGAAGLGELRTSLRRRDNPALPASWARLELSYGSTLLAQGAADEQGSALLLFALPEPRVEPLLGLSSPDLFERTHWEVSLRVFWQPEGSSGEPPDWFALHAQPEVAIRHESLVLQAGTPLIARSPDASFLFVDG